MEPQFPMKENNLKSALNAYGINTNTNISHSRPIPIIEPGYIAIKQKGANTRARIMGWRWTIYQETNTPIATIEIPVGKNPPAKIRQTKNETSISDNAANTENGGILRDPNTQKETIVIYQDGHWNTQDGATIAPLLNQMK